MSVPMPVAMRFHGTNLHESLEIRKEIAEMQTLALSSFQQVHFRCFRDC
jgi:hypothetical protein